MKIISKHLITYAVGGTQLSRSPSNVTCAPISMASSGAPTQLPINPAVPGTPTTPTITAPGYIPGGNVPTYRLDR